MMQKPARIGQKPARMMQEPKKNRQKLRARAAAQLQFSGRFFEKPEMSFGGDLLKGNNPKMKRPLESKLPLHVVLRCEKSVLRLPKTFAQVNSRVKNTAVKSGVKIYSYANVGNHLHLVVQIKNRQAWSNFVRRLTGSVALFVRKSLKLRAGQRFWRHRPFTRVVNGWGRAFKSISNYLRLNQLEGQSPGLRRQAEQIDKLFRFAQNRVRLTERVGHKLFAELNKIWREPLTV